MSKPGGKSNQQPKVTVLPITIPSLDKSNDQSGSQPANPFVLSPNSHKALQAALRSTFKGQTANFARIIEAPDAEAKDGAAPSERQPD